MHHVRSQRRLAHMTGRKVPSTEVLLDRRMVHEAHIAGRGSARVGYPGAKLGNNNGPNVVPTCVIFRSFILSSWSSRAICQQRRDGRRCPCVSC